MEEDMPKTALAIDPQSENFPYFPDGIYIGLSNERYHADEALGSSNIRDLIKGANLFWHKSPMNPKRPKNKPTPAKIVGNATHRLLLDGEKFFKAEYIRGPYGPEDDYSPGEKSSMTKAAKAKLMEGQELLSQEEYDFVVGCKEVLDADPNLKGCLDNGLSEVSIFWTRPDGIRCKARLDKLKLKGIGDIKTIANDKDRPLDQACLLDIATYRYDIPAAHYMEGRRQMARLLEGEFVFVGDECSRVSAKTDEGVALLSFLEECIRVKTFAFQLVFIPKKGAPDAWSCVLSPGNPILDAAHLDIETAIGVYKEAKAKYGTSRWLPGHEVAELDFTDLPYSFGKVSPRARS
jgi:PDDEXK-like domain of unknown function (DUF3799)